jgi:hypothetical protein
MAVGAWGRDFGPIESGLLARLPQDVQKLEWMVKLSSEALRQFAEDLDCRGTPRATVIKAVKGILNKDRPAAQTEGRGTTLQTIEMLLRRLVSLLDGLDPTSPDGDAAERVWDLLITAAEKLEPLSGT